MNNLLIYDTFPLAAEGAALAIKEQKAGLNLLIATSREMVERLTEIHPIDLAIVGVEGSHEFENVRLITRKKIPAVVLYGQPREAFILKSTYPRIVGLVSRYLGAEAFGTFISEVLENGKGMCPITKEYFFDNLDLILNQEPLRHEKSRAKPKGIDSLSKREQEIFFLLKDGKGISVISRELGLKMSTVGTVKKRIFGKLNINNVVQLVKSR